MSTAAVKKRRMRWERRKESPGKSLVTVGTSRKETVAAQVDDEQINFTSTQELLSHIYIYVMCI